MTSPRWAFSNSRPVSRIEVPSLNHCSQPSLPNHRHSSGDDSSVILRSHTSPISRPSGSISLNRLVIHRQSTRARCHPVPIKTSTSTGNLVRSLPSSPPIVPAFHQNSHNVGEVNKLLRKASNQQHNPNKFPTSPTFSTVSSQSSGAVAKTQFTAVLAPDCVRRDDRLLTNPCNNENQVHINVVPGFHYPICGSSTCDGPEDLAAIGQRVFRPILQRKHSSLSTTNQLASHTSLTLPLKATHSAQAKEPSSPVMNKVALPEESTVESVTPSEENTLQPTNEDELQDATERISISFSERYFFRAECDLPPPEAFKIHGKRKYPSQRRRKRTRRKSHQSHAGSSALPDKYRTEMQF